MLLDDGEAVAIAVCLRLAAGGTVEGLGEAGWILTDYFDVVVPAFPPGVRDFYRLEQLWGDVPRLELELEDVPSRA